MTRTGNLNKNCGERKVINNAIWFQNKRLRQDLPPLPLQLNKCEGFFNATLPASSLSLHEYQANHDTEKQDPNYNHSYDDDGPSNRVQFGTL